MSLYKFFFLSASKTVKGTPHTKHQVPNPAPRKHKALKPSLDVHWPEALDYVFIYLRI